MLLESNIASLIKKQYSVNEAVNLVIQIGGLIYEYKQPLDLTHFKQLLLDDIERFLIHKKSLKGNPGFFVFKQVPTDKANIPYFSPGDIAAYVAFGIQAPIVYQIIALICDFHCESDQLTSSLTKLTQKKGVIWN